MLIFNDLPAPLDRHPHPNFRMLNVPYTWLIAFHSEHAELDHECVNDLIAPYF